jgi:hypothetical protein
LAGLAVLSGTTWPQAPSAASARAVAQPIWDKDEEAAIQCLRGLRKKERPSDEELARRLSRAGEKLVPFHFGVLAARRVPALAADEEPQVLSEIQERAILSAVALLDRTAVLAHVELALALDGGLPRRHAALGCLGAVGRSNDLVGLFELALTADEKKPDERMAAALRRAVTTVCTRDPRALEQLITLRRVTRPELLPMLVRAVGDTHDPRGLAYLSDVTYWHEDLALEVLGQVPALGPSGDEQVDGAMRVRLRSFLDERQPAHCRAAITGLAALGDQEGISPLIPLLASENPGLAQNAHRALIDLTGLLLPPEAEAWQSWHEAELAWLVRQKPAELQRLHSHEPAYVVAALRSLLAHPLARAELRAALPDLLQSQKPALRILACRTLAEIEAHGAVEKLVWTLEDSQPDVVTAAHEALRKLTGLALPAEPQAWQAAMQTQPRSTQL